MPRREIFECDVCHVTTERPMLQWRVWERRPLGVGIISPLGTQPTSPLILCSDECERKAILPNTDDMVKTLRELQAIVASDPKLSDRKRKILADATAIMLGDDHGD